MNHARGEVKTANEDFTFVAIKWQQKELCCGKRAFIFFFFFFFSRSVFILVWAMLKSENSFQIEGKKSGDRMCFYYQKILTRFIACAADLLKYLLQWILLHEE